MATTPAVLIIAGASRADFYVDTLRDLSEKLGIGHAVQFREDVDSSDKLLYYGAADLFVAVSDNVQETYGLTLLEAMAAGLPTVAAAWDGYREIVRDGETGILVPTYRAAFPEVSEHVQRIAESAIGYGHRDLHEGVVVDVEALANAMRTVLGNADVRHRMGDAGRALCRAEYEQATQAKRIGDFLLDRVVQAQSLTWPVPDAPWPYHDAIGKRFAHYASGGDISLQQRIVPGHWGKDPKEQAAIIGSLGLTGRQELTLIQDILGKVAQSPPISLHDLSHAFSKSPYTPEQIAVRAVRCIKYGLLGFAEPGA